MEKEIKTKTKEVSRSGISSFLVKNLPQSFLDKLKITRNGMNYIKANFSDSKNNLRDMNVADNRKLLFNVLIDTHIIEKGLSHETIRHNFGREPLTRLAENLNKLISYKMSDKEEFNYAISTLSEYYKLHSQDNVDTDFFEELMGEHIMSLINDNNYNYGGSIIIDKNSKDNNKKKSYKELVENRFTIRNFDNSEVSKDKIIELIRIASKSPSACNRQSSRIIVIKNKKIIKKVLDIQGGFRGYILPNILLVTVVDMRAYSSYTDRNMSYVDGGLFTMSIVYGIEYEGLGACLLNTSFTRKKEVSIRKILDMNKSERFVAIIAVGNLKEKNNVAKSYRVDSAEITRVIE